MESEFHDTPAGRLAAALSNAEFIGREIEDENQRHKAALHKLHELKRVAEEQIVSAQNEVRAAVAVGLNIGKE